MAQILCTLTAELELCYDAVAEIEMIMRALVKCHGAQYRAIERRIEQLMDGETSWGEPKAHSIGEGRFIFEPWPQMKAIIAEARGLGVI
jgi:hypothetical protein